MIGDAVLTGVEFGDLVAVSCEACLMKEDPRPARKRRVAGWMVYTAALGEGTIGRRLRDLVITDGYKVDAKASDAVAANAAADANVSCCSIARDVLHSMDVKSYGEVQEIKGLLTPVKCTLPVARPNVSDDWAAVRGCQYFYVVTRLLV